MTESIPDTSPPPAPPGMAIRWLMLAVFFALLPAIVLEAATRQGLWFWDRAFLKSQVNTDSRRALRLEAGLRVYAETRPKELSVMLIGNSLIGENVDPEELKLCCGPVGTLGTNGLTLLETAMLADWLVKIEPQLVVIAISHQDVHRKDAWDKLRFYDKEAAWALSEPEDLIEHSSAHLRGLVHSQATLFRHRHALLEVAGDEFGVPFREMLEVVPNECVATTDVPVRELPTRHTLALGHISERLQAAGVDLLVFSSPYEPGEKPPDKTVRKYQQDLDFHIDSLAREHGFTFVPSGHFKQLSASLYKDALHLKPEGRSELTRQLIPHIQDALAKRRSQD